MQPSRQKRHRDQEIRLAHELKALHQAISNKKQNQLLGVEQHLQQHNAVGQQRSPIAEIHKLPINRIVRVGHRLIPLILRRHPSVPAMEIARPIALTVAGAMDLTLVEAATRARRHSRVRPSNAVALLSGAQYPNGVPLPNEVRPSNGALLHNAGPLLSVQVSRDQAYRDITVGAERQHAPGLQQAAVLPETGLSRIVQQHHNGHQSAAPLW